MIGSQESIRVWRMREDEKRKRGGMRRGLEEEKKGFETLKTTNEHWTKE